MIAAGDDDTRLARPKASRDTRPRSMPRYAGHAMSPMTGWPFRDITTSRRHYRRTIGQLLPNAIYYFVSPRLQAGPAVVQEQAAIGAYFAIRRMTLFAASLMIP